MIYMKTPTGKRIPADKLHCCCDCPVCGKEVALPDFWDLMCDNTIEFDESSAVLCDECGRKAAEQAVNA